MVRPLEVQNLGVVPYAEALALQHSLVDDLRNGAVSERLLFVEHPPVFTLGRKRTAAANVLQPGDTPVIQVERGGDVTWHGPGQLVGYPILALQEAERDVHRVLRQLETAVVRVLALNGLTGMGGELHTGVWVEEKKVASVGVAIRDWVTFHGFALNVDPDLSWFRRINPCGLGSEVMTSMRALGVEEVDTTRLRLQLATEIADLFGRRLVAP